MIIPKLHYISQGSSTKDHLNHIQKACTSGIELVLLNLKGVSEKKILKTASEAREITSHFQTRLIIKTDYKIAKTIKADGVYLEKTDSCPTIARKHLFSWQIIGATANSLEDCKTLIDKDVDYICLSPFRASTTNANSSLVLGLNGYSSIIEGLKTEVPIIGFGAINTEDVTAILQTGVSGIAVSDEITRNFDSIRIFNQLLNASVTEEQRYTFE